MIKESNKNDDKNEQIRKKDTKIKVLTSELKKQDLEILLLRHRLHDMNNNISKVLQNKNKDKWGGMLKEMLEKTSKNVDTKNRFLLKRDVQDKEIIEILQQAEEKSYNVNDELLRQAKWITKKLYLVNATGKKLREIKEDNIQAVLMQNGKLIEECNLLRSENEKLTHKVTCFFLLFFYSLDEIFGENRSRWYEEKEKIRGTKDGWPVIHLTST